MERAPVAQLHVVEAPLARVRVFGIRHVTPGVFGGGSDACLAQAVEGVLRVAHGRLFARWTHSACPSVVARESSSAFAAPVTSSPARS